MAHIKEHQRLYNTTRWRKARLAWLAANPVCAMGSRIGQVHAANVVDHIKPHKGDDQLFWEQSNWQSLCKHCHDSHKQAQERGSVRGSVGNDGLPNDGRKGW